jgi:Tfp pilus assembly protein PilV
VTAVLYRLRDERGFSIVETLTAMVVTAIIVPAMVTMMTVVNHWSTEEQTDAALQTQVRSFTDGLVADFRQAYTGDVATAPVEAIGSTFTFDSPDRMTPFHDRRISIRLNGTQVERSSVSSTNTNGPPWTYPGGTPKWIAQVPSVTAFTITYYDDTGAVTATTSAVRTIKISLTVKTTSSKARSFTYTGSSTMRQTVTS